MLGNGLWSTVGMSGDRELPIPVTPFSWSLYIYIRQFAMPGFFRRLHLLEPGVEDRVWGKIQAGRPLWNLEGLLDCLQKIPGLEPSEVAGELRFNGLPERLRQPRSIWERFKTGIPVLLRLERMYRNCLARNHRFRREFTTFTARFLQADPAAPAREGEPPLDLTRFTTADFARRFRQLITEIYFKTENAFFSTGCLLTLSRLQLGSQVATLREAGHEISLPALLSGVLRIRHLGVPDSLHTIAAEILAKPGLAAEILATSPDEIDGMLANRPEATSILRQANRLLERQGFYGAHGPDLASPRWTEDRSSLWRLLQTFLQDSPGTMPEPLVVREKRQHDAYRAEVRRVCKALSSGIHEVLPLRRLLFLRTLRRTRLLFRWREEMQVFSLRVLGIIRRWALEAGRRLNLDGGEVFRLTWQEILAGLEGSLDAGELRHRLRAANEESPESLRSDVSEIIPSFPQHHAFHGTGGSGGEARGIIRLVPTLDAIDRLRRGEILVTRSTDPGWTPVFHLLGGVVTESGGLLSHAAVIAREYGIPAVLGLRSAMHLLRDGQQVRIDGANGTIEPLEEAEAGSPITLLR